jgi:hypothetical protein
MRTNNLFSTIAVPLLLLSHSPLNKETSSGNITSKKEINISDATLFFSEKETTFLFQPDYVTQYWETIVASLTTVCRNSVVFTTLFNSFSGTAGVTATFENGLISRAIASYGAAGRQVIVEFLKTLIRQYTTPAGFIDPGSGKILKTEAELVARLVKNPNIWRGMRMGSASITVVLAVAVAFIAGTAGYAVGTAIIKKQELEVKASEDAAFANALVLMARAIQAGKLKLLPGVTQQTAVTKIRENLEIGRAPFLNVFEVRPCPDIKGTWTCTLFVKEVKGTSNIKEGSNRLATFTIDQENCDATLHFNNNQISGEFLAGETIASQLGGKTVREERDEVVFTKNLAGTLTEARLTIYGIGSGSRQGTMDIEIEQKTSDGTYITSGGRLTRK